MNNFELYEKKKLLRAFMKDKLNNIPSNEIEENSKIISLSLFSQKYWINTKKVLCYSSFGWEVDTKRIIQRALNENKLVGLPRIANGTINFYKIKNLSENLVKNSYGIKEPVKDSEIIRFEDDINNNSCLCIVPGIAFDLTKNRLGRGGGFYDKFLSLNKFYKVGICHDLQLVKNLPVGSLDIKLDSLITNNKII